MPAPDANRALERTLKLSPFARRTLSARPGLESHLAEWQARPVSAEEMRAALGAGEDLSARLRALRARVMLALLHRDLNGLASLDEVFETMTGLADTSIRASTDEALRRGFAVHGEPEGADT